MDPVTAIAWIVAFVVVTVAITGLTGRFGLSAPVTLVVVGAIASFVPGVPRVHIEPDLILFGLLPPLLFAAAIRTSLIDVRARNDSILLLSVALVAFTVVTVGFVAWWAVPGITIAAGLAFGAVVAPTDAVAVTAITGKVPLPRRVVTILEGESLLNDATALVALNAAVAAIVAPVTPFQVGGDFVLAVVVGAAVGLAVGVGIAWIRKRLHSAVLDTSLSLVTPFIAFLPAQELHGSGALAVVGAGLYLGYRSPVVLSAEARVAERLNWKTIQFLLENAVFLFIGLNLAGVLEGVVKHGPGLWPTVGISFALLAAVIASRFVWIFATMMLYRYGPQRLRERAWNIPSSTVTAAAGIRGVVTLAAAFLLPADTPQRPLLQFLAFVVVLGTLLQALPLPRLIRAVHLPAPNLMQEWTERQMLTVEAKSAGLERLDEVATDDDEERVVEQLRAASSFLADALENPAAEGREPLSAEFNRLRSAMIDAERKAVLDARHEGRYQENAVQAVLAAIDAEETALRARHPKAIGE
ncbi:Na+/H+ antiporter [Frondihabitans australicus]|uniref:Sodium/proton antiporter (CPA1 family) n=1 Tax=Frondihabitans australicus TaxID=386892 RepID=A0A495IJL3_9MICO|nr:Na+/H+ antiporter [Frondihabitans australicus]RKR76157.1 sodium/proton antiporter (CPA1 family) [Frondihabitans australicus]